MRNYLLAAVAAAAIATPAVAQDAGPYVGIEGGILFPKDTNIDAAINYDDVLLTDATYDNLIDVDYKQGYDVDVIAGYDFGAFRVEGELGYKRAKIDGLELDEDFIADYEEETGFEFDEDDFDFDLSSKVKVTSAMVNVLGDFGSGGFRIYGGGGFGRAKVKAFGGSDSEWAYQLIAGVGMPVASNVEVGLKYRYFRTGKLDFAEEFDAGDALVGFSNNGRFSSHSLLASLVFGFGAPAEPAYVEPVTVAPPAAVAPATQTCPDGSVILATDMCPMAPPPPPPPVQSGERG